MIKKIIVLLLVLIAGVESYGQILNLEGTSGNVLRETKYAKIEGSPYLFPSYKSAKVFDRDGAQKNVFAKYDSYKEEIEVHNDGNPIILDSKAYGAILFDFIDEIENKRVKVLFKNGFNIDGYRTIDYFQVLKDKGSLRFLKKIKTQRIEDEETSYGGNNDVASKFVTTTKYYIVNGEDVSGFKKLSKSSVLKAFGDTESDTDYIKKNKMKLKTEDEVVSFLLYKEKNK